MCACRNWFAGAGSLGVPYGTGGPGCLSNQGQKLPCNFVDITRAQFFWQAWSSLAFGSRGLFEYFYFQDPGHFHCREFMVYPGMLRSDGSESDHYLDAQQVNSAVMALAPTLMQLRCTNVSFINQNDPSSQLLPAEGGDPTCAGVAPGCLPWPTMAELHGSGLCPLKDVSGGAFIVGCFTHEHENRTQAAILVNYEVTYNMFATIEFTDAVAATSAREVSQVTGRDVAIVDAAPHMRGLQVLLRPGEGKLFVVRGGE